MNMMKTRLLIAGLLTAGLLSLAHGQFQNSSPAPSVSNITGLGTGIATWLATPSSANLLAAVTSPTGTGSLVFATSPTLVTPILGTPTSGTLTNVTGLPITSGVSGLGTGVATFLATPSSANLASAVTGETGTGAVVFGTSPTIATPTITGTIAGSPGITGTTTNDAATAGNIGQYVSSVIPVGSAITLTTATEVNVTSVSLTAGDWDIWGTGDFGFGVTTNITYGQVYISTTTGSSSGQLTNYGENSFGSAGIVPGSARLQTVKAGPIRVSLASTTIMYLVVAAGFSVSNCVASGGLYARRVR